MNQDNATRAAGSSGPACSAPYGFCPICGAPGANRERRPDGNDICRNGHTYPSRKSVGEVRPTPPEKCPTCGRPNNEVWRDSSAPGGTDGH
jgi:hypothetical protein